MSIGSGNETAVGGSERSMGAVAAAAVAVVVVAVAAAAVAAALQ
jgi:hypothetical protein